MAGQNSKKQWNWNQNKKPNHMNNQPNKHKIYTNANSTGQTNNYRKTYYPSQHNDIEKQQTIHPNLVYVRDFTKSASRGGSTPSSPKSMSPPLSEKNDSDCQKCTEVSSLSSTSSLKSVDSMASNPNSLNQDQKGIG
jgi:hypothetical protein